MPASAEARGHKILQNWSYGLLQALPPAPGASKRAENAFTAITSQPLLGYFELHVWLVGFSCNRSALEAAALSMQVSSSLHIVFMLQYLR